MSSIVTIEKRTGLNGRTTAPPSVSVFRLHVYNLVLQNRSFYLNIRHFARSAVFRSKRFVRNGFERADGRVGWSVNNSQRFRLVFCGSSGIPGMCYQPALRDQSTATRMARLCVRFVFFFFLLLFSSHRHKQTP